jgi:protein-S-isoprenylcysteine O-methyltransferase Ste14
MKKSMIAIFIICLTYIAPLLPRTDLLSNERAVVLMIVCAIVLLTQPPISLREAREKKSSDKNSIVIIMVAGISCQMISVLEWAYLNDDPSSVHNDVLVGVGLSMILGGMTLRLWSIRTLGRYFTATVQVNPGQSIIDNGPYSIIRHPSYLGAFAAIIGGALLLEATIGAVISLVTMLCAYKIRIETEEEILVAAFGAEYRTYQKLTWRLIPFVW